MSNLICNFCAHGNPEGSKFCNECGSPLNLTQCSRCEAINTVSAKQCYQCGAPLSQSETEEIAIPPAAWTEIAQSGSLPTKDDPVPIALGERLDQLMGEPLVISHEPQETTAEDRPSLAVSLTADPASRDNDSSSSPSHSGGATYRRRNPSRARGLFLVVVLVAVAGAVYWTSLNPTHPPEVQTMTDEGRATAPEPASSAPAVTVESADNAMQSPTGARESSSHGAEAAPQVGGQAPESEDAQAPSRAEAADSPDHGTTKITSARAAGSMRTRSAARTAVQASTAWWTGGRTRW